MTEEEQLIEHVEHKLPFLKHCRCCGAETPRMLFGKKMGRDIDVFRIMCDDCGNTGEIFLNELECVASWNKRLIVED